MTNKSNRKALFNLETPAKKQGPVECLGMSLENDEAWREHFLGLLREGLEELHTKLSGCDRMEERSHLQCTLLPHWSWPGFVDTLRVVCIGGSRYTEEFKRRVVELVCARRTPEKLAEEFESSAQSIRKWMRGAEIDDGRHEGLATREREKVRRLGEERDFKKTAVWFARETSSLPAEDSSSGGRTGRNTQ